MTTKCHIAHNEALQRIRWAHESDANELSLSDLALESLPEELINLTELTTLRIDGCHELKDISSLRYCKRIEVLDLRACPQLTDLSPLQELHTLRELFLGIRDWQAVFDSSESTSILSDINPLTYLVDLITLTLSGCDRISNLQPLANLKALQHLDLSWCKQLQDLQPLTQLNALQILKLNFCKQFQDLRPLAGLTALQNLGLGGCEQLHDLRPLTGLTTLKQLHLGGCRQLHDLYPLADLTTLEYLNLALCEQIQDLQPLASLTTLQHLDLTECKQLQDLKPLIGLKALQHLDLTSCEQLQDLKPLTSLTALQHLCLQNCIQLQDLRPLAGLIALQHLNLTSCEQLQDLQPLAGLIALQHLSIGGCEQLQNLQPLSGLTALQYLGLNSFKQLQDLQPLAGLTALQHLNLGGCEQLQNLWPLTGLTALQHLNLTWCKQLQDLRPLAGLTALQNLGLAKCEQLQDLRPLTGLTTLKQLHLGGCRQLHDPHPLANLTTLEYLDLNECKQIQDLKPLTGLTALQHLNLALCEQIQDLRPLAGLTALQFLDLSGCKQIHDLNPLTSLTALQHLNLALCEQIQDLAPLATLTRLKKVNVSNGSLLDCSPTAQPLASWNELEQLCANRLIGAPSELGANGHWVNSLPRIRGWQADLIAGEAPNSTVKLFVLGNGRIGKTQICRRLCNERFDPSIPSTHGISLGRLRLVEAKGDQPAVDAHFWDFGGQDIYLGTHALFLDERAIYVIAWHPSHEEPKELEENGMPMRDRPLTYWLQYVQSLAGSQAPVIVVQTQCDRELDVQSPPISDDHGFTWLHVISSSAKLDDGLEELQLKLKHAARYQLERYGKVRLPASWIAVGETLRARIDNKTLPRDEFDEICRMQHGASISSVVLEYLHRSGQVFWREGIFDNQVVLDLAWALNGIYAVLERNTALPMIRHQAGRFSSQLLAALVWGNYSEAECTLFLSLMEQCQICFKVTEDVFIAPALLPERAMMDSAMQQVWRGAEPDAVVRLDYAFLHEGVLRAMLCGIGRQAGVHAVYWAYGVCFYDAEHKSTVRISSQLPDVSTGQAGGSITVETAGSGAASLTHHLVESIQRLNIGRSPQVIWEFGQDSLEVRTEAETPNPIATTFDAVKPSQPPRQTDEPQSVYVSYAWGGESDELVDKLEQRLPKNFKLIRDKNDMRPGDWISNFMMEIGRADLVLVVLSDKYLRSVYCMQELLHLFKISLGERDQLMQRMVPLIVGELKCADLVDRDIYVAYWRDRYEIVNTTLNDRSWQTVSQPDREQGLAILDFQHRISELLAWVSDTLMPQGADLHTKGIDAAIHLLQQRISNLHISEFRK